MTIAEFAEHLGVTTRAVDKWAARGASIAPRAELQRALDTAVERAEPAARARLTGWLGSSGSESGGAEAATRREPFAPSAGEATGSAREHLVVPAIRRAMHEVTFAPTSRTEPLSLVGLDRQVASAWRLWHASPTPRTDVGRLLPGLIHDAHISVRVHDDADRRRAQAVTGELYRLVQRVLAHVAEPRLHALAVERGRAMSEAADTPHALALAAWSSAIAMSALGDFDEAVRIAKAGACAVQARIEFGAPAMLGIYGALQLEIVAASGFAGRGEVATTHLQVASTAATRVPPGYWHPQSGFDRAGVAIMSMIVRVAGGDTAGAISGAEHIDPAAVRSRVRRSRLLLECALAHARQGEPFAAVHYLRSAVDEAGEAITPIPWAGELASEVALAAPPALRHEPP
ncbi:MAG: helix-turn-helix domain-containing protein [Angustibacter sp.]